MTMVTATDDASHIRVRFLFNGVEFSVSEELFIDKTAQLACQLGF